MSDRNDLVNGIKGILAAWETGDLAAAVNKARLLIAEEPKQVEKRPMTVLGIYPEEADGSIDRYVEHVEAADVAKAIVEAKRIDPDRCNALMVSVFEGHLIDMAGDISEEAAQ